MNNKDKIMELVLQYETDYETLKSAVKQLIKAHDNQKLATEPGDSTIIEKLRKIIGASDDTPKTG